MGKASAILDEAAAKTGLNLLLQAIIKIDVCH